MKINLGSGQRKFGPGWINVDSQAKWEPDVVADGGAYLYGLELDAEIICLHHVLEHFGCGEGTDLVSAAYTALRPGGSLLIFIPNMNELARMWLEGRLTTQVYMTNVYGAYMSDEADRHKWGYDPATLSGFLQRTAPWSRIAPFDWRKIEGADIAGPDRWILGMEAVK